MGAGAEVGMEEKLMAGADAAVTVASLRRAGTPEGCSMERSMERGRAEDEKETAVTRTAERTAAEKTAVAAKRAAAAAAAAAEAAVMIARAFPGAAAEADAAADEAAAGKSTCSVDPPPSTELCCPWCRLSLGAGAEVWVEEKLMAGAGAAVTVTSLSQVYTLAEKQSCELSTGWLSLYDQYERANEKCQASEQKSNG